MSFWSSQQIGSKGHQIFTPFDPDNIDSACYNLALGSEVFVSPTPDTPLKDRKIINLKDDTDTVIIPPGQFAFLITEEKVSIPRNSIGFISIRFGMKAQGIINVSGFHVDPGYNGKLVFAIFNASGFPKVLKKGERMFSIWLSSLEDYDSKPRTKLGYARMPLDFIDAKNPESSIPVLAEKIEDIEKRIEASSIKYGLVLGLLIPINIAIFRYILHEWDEIFKALSNDFWWVISILVSMLAVILLRKPFKERVEISIHFIKNRDFFRGK